MSQTSQSRSIRTTNEGIKKLNDRRLEKGLEESKKGWSQEELARRAFVDVSTVKRFLKGVPVDRDSVLAITNALGLQPEEVVDPKEWNPVEQTADAIDWGDVCGKVLARQRENQRLRRQATERGFELNVYVPLGLVERKQQQRRCGDVPLEEVYQLTEEVITKEYDNDKFLTEVIEPGKSKRIAIIGEPGAGKTTLQEKIAVWIHENNKGLPICIPLGGLQGKTLEDYLQQIWLKAGLRFIEPDALGVEAQAFASLQKLFREGKVWLLLDGVDVMAATSPVQALATIKEQLTDWLVEARVVLTCRLNVWDANVTNMLTGFETYRTLEFKPEQVEDFIRQWFACAEESQQYCWNKTDLTPPAPIPYQGMGESGSPLLAGEGQGERFACAEESQRGEELLRKLQEPGKERIRELVRNPLRLSLLCQTSYVLPVDEPLPETKAALYERFTRYFYEWKQEQHPTTRTERRQLNQALGELAKAGINSKVRFRLGEDFACDVMGEPLFDLACRLGWLNLVDRDAKTDEAVYAFFHPTFQEYFSACAIDDWRYFLNHDNENPNPLLSPNPSLEYDDGKPSYRIFEPQWKEVILLWLGREEVDKGTKETFIEALMKFEDDCGYFYRYRAYFLAAVGITEFGNCSFADEIVAQIVEWGLLYFNIEIQGQSIFIAPVVVEAWEVISKTNRSKAITTLVKFIPHCQNENTRFLLTFILGKIGKGNSIAIKAFAELIETVPDELTLTRFKFADMLWKIKDNAIAIADLVELIENSQDEYLRMQAAESLGEIGNGNRRAIRALVKLIRNSQDEYTRIIAAKSLGKLRKDHPLAIVTLHELIENSQDEYTRMRAAESLGEIGKNNYLTNLIAIMTLVELIKKSWKIDICEQAARSLKKIGKDNPIAIEALMELIGTSQNEETSRIAAEILGKIDKNNPIAIETLVNLIRNSQTVWYRRIAAESLGKINKDNPLAIEPLVELIRNSRDEYMRGLAAESLGKIGTNNAIAIKSVVELIENTQDEYICRLAVESLGKIGKDNSIAIKALVELIRKSQDEDTRIIAAKSLTNILAEAQMAEIVTVLKDAPIDQSWPSSSNGLQLFNSYYAILWKCAQNMPYPDFYQACQPDNHS